MATTRILTLLILVSSVVVGAEPTASTTARFSVNVDLGTDVGQSFGSLFEVQDREGRVVAGAGFHDVYNTHFRTDHHTLQFFVRPDESNEEFTWERLPHPDLDCGVYLFDLDGQVYCFSSARGDSVRRWDEAGSDWVDELPPRTTGFRFGDGVMRVGRGQLTLAENAAWYDAQMILSPPAEGRYHHFYYANGQLCFYHRVEGDRPGTEIYACAWIPGDGPIDLTSAVRLPTTVEVETPFAWGQWQEELLTVSNMGGVYVFADGRWTTVLEPDDSTSYQVYSMLRWHDRLLLAQYPTGNVFEYRGGGEVPRLLEGWPPVMPGVSTSARECQTLGIYRGDLLAGVWPWAELWRRDRDAGRWSLLGRMFTHPPATDEFVHPYETEARGQGLVANHWGQRIMVCL